MKILSVAAVFLAGSTCTAFAPTASRATFGRMSNMNKKDCPNPLHMNVPFFAQEQASESKEIEEETEVNVEGMSLDEEVEILVQKEIAKSKRVKSLSNDRGMAYAPWMGISEEEEGKIRTLMREKTIARRARQEQEKGVSGNLLRDSQAQELSGTGLSYKIIDGEVELEWATKTEKETNGFIVKRRAAKTDEYSVVASYKDWGPLASKGPDGGIYRFLDTTVTPGGWVYRISEEDRFGNQADICQCLVEVQTEDEQKAAVIAAVGFVAFAVLAVVAGIAADPYGGF